MPVWRVKANNAVDPTARMSMAPAIAPPYAPTPFSVHGGLIRLAAAPGTHPVPSPRPPGTHQRNASGNPEVQDLRPSDVSPDTFLPRLFIQFADHLCKTVRVACTNEIPIPAGNYVRLPQVASKTPPRIGGLGTIPAPRAFIRWPSVVPSVPSSD